MRRAHVRRAAPRRASAARGRYRFRLPARRRSEAVESKSSKRCSGHADCAGRESRCRISMARTMCARHDARATGTRPVLARRARAAGRAVACLRESEASLLAACARLDVRCAPTGTLASRVRAIASRAARRTCGDPARPACIAAAARCAEQRARPSVKTRVRARLQHAGLLQLRSARGPARVRRDAPRAGRARAARCCSAMPPPASRWYAGFHLDRMAGA